MTRIGVTELRQRAGEYVRRARDGETIEVTNRGRPIARLVPIVGSGMEHLEREEMTEDDR